MDCWNDGTCVFNGFLPCDHCGGCNTNQDDD